MDTRKMSIVIVFIFLMTLTCFGNKAFPNTHNKTTLIEQVENLDQYATPIEPINIEFQGSAYEQNIFLSLFVENNQVKSLFVDKINVQGLSSEELKFITNKKMLFYQYLQMFLNITTKNNPLIS